jgi:hypothetical protein
MAKKKGLLDRASAVPPRGGYDRRRANRISLRVVVAAAIAFAAYMAVELSTDPAQADGEALRVRALFGFRVALSDIRELKLEKEPIALGARIFGDSAFGLFREGDFEVDGLGRARVFLKNPNASYITIRTGDRNYAISLGSLEKDQLLYDRIKLGARSLEP